MAETLNIVPYLNNQHVCQKLKSNITNKTPILSEALSYYLYKKKNFRRRTITSEDIDLISIVVVYPIELHQFCAANGVRVLFLTACDYFITCTGKKFSSRKATFREAYPFIMDAENYKALWFFGTKIIQLENLENIDLFENVYLDELLPHTSFYVITCDETDDEWDSDSNLSNDTFSSDTDSYDGSEYHVPWIFNFGDNSNAEADPSSSNDSDYEIRVEINAHNLEDNDSTSNSSCTSTNSDNTSIDSNEFTKLTKYFHENVETEDSSDSD